LFFTSIEMSFDSSRPERFQLKQKAKSLPAKTLERRKPAVLGAKKISVDDDEFFDFFTPPSSSPLVSDNEEDEEEVKVHFKLGETSLGSLRTGTNHGKCVSPGRTEPTEQTKLKKGIDSSIEARALQEATMVREL
jgi:hypothetical protein